MSVDEVLKMALAFLKVIAWPAVVLTAVILFRRQLTGLLQRLESVDGPGNLKAVFGSQVATALEGSVAAEVEATELVKTARHSVELAHHADEETEPVPPEKESTENVGEVPASSDAASHSSFRAPEAVWQPDAAVWSALRRGVQRGFTNASAERLLKKSWSDLEDESKHVVQRLGLIKDAPMLAYRPDPVALFGYLYDQGHISRETLETARRAEALRALFIHGVGSEAYVDEVVATADAIDGLTRSLRKIGAVLYGQRKLARLLESHGDEELPSQH